VEGNAPKFTAARSKAARAMMRRATLQAVLAATASIGLARIAHAQDASHLATPFFPSHEMTCPQALLHGCCDNYCRKPMPCLHTFCVTPTGDTYCAKPCPCVPCFPSYCGCDCYCRKPFPDLCRPLAADFFVCPDPCAANAGSGRSYTTVPDYMPHVGNR
jgi:hypothetical protein